MLADGQVPKYVPNWWNPYAPNIGQEDPQKKQKVINTIKLVFVVITMLGGAILALTINVFVKNAYDSKAGPSFVPQVHCPKQPPSKVTNNSYPQNATVRPQNATVRPQKNKTAVVRPAVVRPPKSSTPRKGLKP